MQKVVLSIVDPWDNRVASIDPLRLAERRGLSIDNLQVIRDQYQENNSTSINNRQQQHTPGGLSSASSSPQIRTPWPWYKPINSNGSSSPSPTLKRCDIR